MKENEDGKARRKWVEWVRQWFQTYGLAVFLAIVLLIASYKFKEKTALEAEKRTSAYQNAITFFLDGEYEQASEKFEEAEGYKTPKPMANFVKRY